MRLHRKGCRWFTTDGRWHIELLQNGLFRVDDRKSGLVSMFDDLSSALRRCGLFGVTIEELSS